MVLRPGNFLSWPRFTRYVCVGGLIFVVAAVVFAPIEMINWDGGFPNAEYRFKFVDGDNHPVPGVTLRVLTQAGGVCHLYPVSDFLPDQVPTSDADGNMIFHHFSDTLEFGGQDHRSLMGITWKKDKAPQFDCVFSLNGIVVYGARFHTLLPRNYDRLPSVARSWKPPDWTSREFRTHSNDWKRHRERLFDVNSDGELDREERVAALCFDRSMDRDEKKVEFVIVERTIVIPAP
jgi:hypothetical protein